ncbi:ATP-binding protein [Actinosynnema sp. ALI-1.44]|uniref:ATP-binding protein n=1 Tax=Actinosynnema sp. ALI-1.44 TaxID=1933779 RepID=UPI001EDBA9D1|nr:LuxR family transcriptional regulator [Actinosynnema sp. ALI-1.44]
MKPQVIGRDREVAVLARALERPSGTILLRGEAGIGKSALAQHALDLAAAQGITVLRGQAHPLHAGLAYAPIVAAVRPLMSQVSEFDGLAHLGTLLGDPRLPASAPTGTSALDRTHMFEAVARLVERFAPAVFFVDDLHWADRGTVELVHYLGRNTEGVLILAAYRPGEADPVLGDLATTVRRTGTELELAPLADTDVAEIAHTLLGSAPEPMFLRDVTRRAKGVPLFVTALVQGGITTDTAVPTIVRDVVLGRLRQLGADERELMEIIAVAGEATTDEVVRSLSRNPQALRNLIVDGLIAERALGRTMAYQVAHPLYAEVAYAEMTIGERRQLHATVLAAIERIDPDDVLALAPHYREAGDVADPTRAVTVMAEAGERALAVRAFDEAIRYFDVAMDLAEPERAARLLEGLGRAHMSLGDPDAASAAWTRGVRLAERHGATESLALLRFRLTMLEAERQEVPAGGDRLADVRGVSLESAEIAIQKFIYTMRFGTLDDTKELSAQLAETAGVTHPVAARAVTHFGQAILHVMDQQFGKAIEQAEVALDAARDPDIESPFYLQYFLLYASILRLLNGDIAGAVDSAREAVRAGALVELPSLACFEHYSLSGALYLAGDYDGALAEVDTGVVAARKTGAPRCLVRIHAMRAFLLAERGELSEAAAALEEAHSLYRAPDQTLIDVTALAATAIALYLDEPPPQVPSDESRTYSDVFAVTMRGLFAGLAGLNTGDPGPAAKQAAALRVFEFQPPLMAAFGDRLDGLRTGDASRLASAVALFDAMGAKVLAAQVALEHSELTGASDRLPEIVDVLTGAGAAHWANRARQQARSLGLRLRPGRRDGILTRREADVVRLLGEGLSNADIAARLFLSGRTVETHLRNSYAKLGLSTRVSLARWAAENLS